VYSLDALRTDGWFERVASTLGSFDALCEILGEQVFAFSLIVGVRIAALAVDRSDVESSLVDFTVGQSVEGEPDPEVMRLPLSVFRQQIVGALLADEPEPALPEDEGDFEGLQRAVGLRYLLLAPLFDYTPRALVVDPSGDSEPSLLFQHLGQDRVLPLHSFQALLREHVESELERAPGPQQAAIDLGKIPEAEAAAAAGDHARVIELLGRWPGPLAMYLRTAEGQQLPPDARASLARALGCLGSACVALDRTAQGEEILRLGIQFAQEGQAAGALFERLGRSYLVRGREAEAIGPLRHALRLGHPPAALLPLLARAFSARGRWIAALACLRQARELGASSLELAEEEARVARALGPLNESLPPELRLQPLQRSD
jgi:hypothetical protein